MNKKGAELPLTTMIVAIIVIVVLVVIIAFFLSGTYSLKQAISRIFYGTTAGTDESLAVQICQQNCEIARTLPEEIRKDSQFCKQSFSIDKNNDGEAEYTVDPSTNKKTYTKYYCKDLKVPCEVSCI